MIEIGFFIGHELQAEQARLLIASCIRQGAGQPHAMVASHVILTEGLEGAIIHQVDIPKHLRSIPFVDKMLGAAAFEQLQPGPFLWMDVDSCFTASLPRFSSLRPQLNPVDVCNVGLPVGSSKTPLWEMVGKRFSVDPCTFPHLTTTVSRQAIYPYWNAGMVLSEPSSRLFSRTAEFLRELLVDLQVTRYLQSHMLQQIFFHQVVFAHVVLEQCGASVAPLPPGLNYPLHMMEQDSDPPHPEDIVSIRYDDYFAKEQPGECMFAELAPWQGKLKPVWYY